MDIYLHLPCLRFIWSQGIVQRQQCYDLTCEDAKGMLSSFWNRIKDRHFRPRVKAFISPLTDTARVIQWTIPILGHPRIGYNVIIDHDIYSLGLSGQVIYFSCVGVYYRHLALHLLSAPLLLGLSNRVSNTLSNLV